MNSESSIYPADASSAASPSFWQRQVLGSFAAGFVLLSATFNPTDINFVRWAEANWSSQMPLTTLLVGGILFAMGTGPVKGFAVTLSLGILTSMFTAILVTRCMVNLTCGGRDFKKLWI